LTAIFANARPCLDPHQLRPWLSDIAAVDPAVRFSALRHHPVSRKRSYVEMAWTVGTATLRQAPPRSGRSATGGGYSTFERVAYWTVAETLAATRDLFHPNDTFDVVPCHA
jgi:hypothetical protein